MEKVTITFNDRPIETERGTNVLKAVLDAGFEIPHYCYHPGLSVAGSCRLCAVEVGQIDKNSGKVTMSPKLVMSCKTTAYDGLIVRSDTEKVIRHQKAIMEFLLIHHPLDCPVCDQAGECLLQDFSYRYGRSYSRYEEPKIKQPLKDVGKNILLYSDRCIMCSRCVRFTREISGGAELAVFDRSNKSEIDVFPGKGVNDKLAGNVVDICPVGALLDKQFLFKQRVWFLTATESICPRCSRGCSIVIDHNNGVIWRLRPRPNTEVNGFWMCDDGRHGFKFVHADERLKDSTVGRGDQAWPVDADTAVQDVSQRLQTAVEEEGGKMAVVLSPFASCEEQWLLTRWLGGFGDKITLVRGPVFSEEKDEVFKSGFTISAEKAPNRRGAEMIMRHAGLATMTFAEMAEAADRGMFDAIWLQGGYPWQDWCPAELLEKVAKVKLLIVQDILPGGHTIQADVVLAGVSWSEKDGCFINDQDITQAFHAAIIPFGNAVSDGEWLWRLSGREGAFDIEAVRAEMQDVIRIEHDTGVVV